MLEDPEGGDPLDTEATAMRGVYLDALREFLGRYRNETAGMQADFVVVNNAMSFDKALVRFLADRQSRF